MRLIHPRQVPLTRNIVKLKPIYNITKLGPSTSIRYYRKVTVGNAIFRSTRAVVIGIALGLTLTIGGIAGAQYYSFRKVQKSQPIPSEWNFQTKLLFKAAIDNEQSQNFTSAAKYYQQTIDSLIGKDKQIDISRKSRDWLTGYADVLMRFGLVQELLNNRQDALEAIQVGYSLPVGTPQIRSKVAIQLGKYSIEDKNLDEAEQHLLQSLQEVASGPILQNLNSQSSPVILPGNIVVNDYQVLPLIELGKLYVKQSRYQDALSSFLATLRSVRNAKETFKNACESGVPLDLHMQAFDINCNEPIIMTYISEILWKLGNKRDAVIWAEGSYYDSFPKSHGIVECGLCAKLASDNLYKMYKNMGLNDQSEIFKQLSESQVVLDQNPSM